MKSWRSLAVSLFALTLASRVTAQGTIAGTVSAAGTQEPLAGARVTVVGTTVHAATDEQGRFGLTGLSGTSVTLEVRRIGYKLARIPARVGDDNLRVTLTVNPTSLEEVVVTGTAGSAQKRELGNSIGTINAADVVGEAPIVSLQSLLNGRTPGVVVLPTAGTIGSGSQIRVRGNASLSLGNNPLLFVDGVRVNNEAATGPVSQAFGSQPISRLNDFNPNDIESIEILKGPSAATLYGTEAANGVINIITKKGRAGAAKWTTMVRGGVNYFADYRSRFPVNYGPVHLATDPAGTGTGPIEAVNFDSLLIGACGSAAATAAGTRCPIYKNGRLQETQVAVSGGTGALTYFASGNLLDSHGVEPTNSERHYSGRLNVGLSPSDHFTIGANLGYVGGPTGVPCDAGCGGYTWTTLSATPLNYNNPARHGFHSSLPYQYDQTVVLWQDLARTTASIRFEHQPMSWLSHRLSLGGDLTNEGDNEYDPRVDSLNSLGFRSISERELTTKTVDYSANAIWNYKPTLRFTTSAGAQYYALSIHSVAASGSVFATPGLKSVTATTTRNPATEGFSDDKSFGVFLQEQLGWRDKVYATAALRSDDHSAFGANFNRVTYPKFSLSWVISEEPWFQIPFLGQSLNELRLRTAYGESGKAPTTYSAIRTYTTTAGPSDAPAVTPNVTGNPNLGPERGKEIELGFDAGFMNDRLSTEFTYYDKRTVDAILDRQLAPSSGQSGTQPFNIGGILNRGIELIVRGTPWRSDNLQVDLTGSIATNYNEVTSLGLGDQYFVTAGTFVRHQVGFPAFGWFEQRVVSDPVMNRATGFPLPAAGQDYPVGVLCADTLANSHGKENPAKSSWRSCVGADGKWGTADDAPNVYLGRSSPPREMAFTGTVTFFKRFHVFSSLDLNNGAKKLDGNTRVRCGIFGRCKENFAIQQAAPTPANFSPAFAAEVDSIRVAEAASNSNLVDFLVTESNFAKWRELTLSYDVPDKYARMARFSRATVSLSGRNLYTWTRYQGFEPEAMFLGGSRGGNTAWEQTTLPQLRSWMITLNLGF